MRNSTLIRPSAPARQGALRRAFALVAIAVMAAVGLPAIATAAKAREGFDKADGSGKSKVTSWAIC
jgi:hypothetical protein